VHEARLATARVARLATTDPDGRLRPHLVPIVFALDGNTLYSAVDRKSKRSRILRRIEGTSRGLTIPCTPELTTASSGKVGPPRGGYP